MLLFREKLKACVSNTLNALTHEHYLINFGEIKMRYDVDQGIGFMRCGVVKLSVMLASLIGKVTQ